MNIKQIVIALIDRLAAYAAREAENENPEETKRQEEAAARRLAEKVKEQKAKAKALSGTSPGVEPSTSSGTEDGWGTSASTSATDELANSVANTSIKENGGDAVPETPTTDGEKTSEKGKEKEVPEEATAVKKFRGIPENVKLFEVFWHQIVELIKVISLMASTFSRV